MFKKLLYFISAFIGLFLLASTVSAVGAFPVATGGTGSTTLTGILIGNGTSPVKTVTIGSNLTLTGTTLSATGSGGSGTVNSGLQGQVGYYAAGGTAISGSSNFTFDGTSKITIGSGDQFEIQASSTLSALAFDNPALPNYIPLTILYTGNVGIGTTSPFSPFAVQGLPGTAGDIITYATTTSGGATSRAWRLDSSGRWIGSSGAGIGTGNLTPPSNGIKTLGSVIVGNTTESASFPATPNLVVANSGSFGNSVWITSTTAGLWFNSVGQFAGGISRRANNDLDFIGTSDGVAKDTNVWLDPTSRLGVGSSTPYATLSVHLNADNSSQPFFAFAIGSSTQSATSTLFSIDNTGSIYTSLGTGCVTATAGLLSASGSCGGIAFPFTPTSYNGQVVNATSTGLWLTGSPFSLVASSTFITMASTTNDNGEYWANLMAGSDIGAKVNAAYAALSATGGTIHIGFGATGAYSFSTAMSFQTSNKPVHLICDPGVRLTWTGSATSTIFNDTRDTPYSFVGGMTDCDFTGSGGNSVAIQVGGSNGAPGTVFDNNHVTGFGLGIGEEQNAYLVTYKNNIVEHNTQDIHIESANNSGENVLFDHNNISDCTAPADCILIETNGLASGEFLENSVDDAQVHIKDGNYITFVGGHFENPNSASIGRYTYIITTPGNFTNLTINGTGFFNGATTQPNSPNQYILNGGNLTVEGATFQSFSSQVVPAAVNNYGGNGANLVVLNYKNVNGALTAFATSTTAFTIDQTTKNVGIGTSTPFAALSVVGASGVVADHYTATSTLATSTFAGDIWLRSLLASSTNIASNANAINNLLTLRNSYPTSGSNGSALTFGVYRNVNNTSLGAAIVGISVPGSDFGDLDPAADIAFYTSLHGQNSIGALTQQMIIKANGNVGIGTSTPGTLLSLGNTGANTINFSTVATSTFGHGINLLSGCFSINGTCIGTVSNIFPNGLVAVASSTFSGVVHINMASTTNLNGELYANGFFGLDIGAQVNAAYAALPPMGGTIHISYGATGAYSFVNPIDFETLNKTVHLICDPGVVLTWTGVATSTIFNNVDTAPYAVSNGMTGCDLQGSGNSSVGIQVGGNNGIPNSIFDNNHIESFGIGIRQEANAYALTYRNNVIEYNTQDVYIDAYNNSGENVLFDHDLIADCLTVTKCFYDSTNGTASLEFMNDSFDDAQVYLEDGNTLTMTGGHMENPNNSVVGQYNYLVTNPGNNTNVTINGTEFVNSSASLGNSPNQYILNGGNLTLEGVTFNSPNSITIPAAVNNYGGNGARLAVLNYKNENASVTTIATTSPAFIIDQITGFVGIGTSTPASLFHVSAGLNATTTVEFDAESVTSRTCFNVRNTTGVATSFYFVGTSMVVEANRCK